MSSAALNSVTRSAIMQIYETKGKDAADAKVMDLLQQCESWKHNQRERGTIKGELSEIALEYHLLWWLSHVDLLTCIKSLCVKSKTSNATAEVDILLANPFKVYLFECKSFKGKKTLTKECFLQGESSSKDVYEQSRYHLKVLEEHLGCCRPPQRREIKAPPYQLVLFELSSDDIEDKREEKWKKAIPALSLATLDTWLMQEFSKAAYVQWNYEQLIAKLKQLDATSENMFKFHMQKIINRKGSK